MNILKTSLLISLLLFIIAQLEAKPRGPKIRKPKIENTTRANMYADNWFVMYINGKLTAVDSIPFIPHNVISVDILPEYPMTIAVMARDNGDPETGMEYNNSNIGDGGFILRFSDGTVTSSKWKAKNFFHGPINSDTENPRVRTTPIPKNWYAVDFDDSSWAYAKTYTEETIGPKKPYYENDFSGAQFIWTDDILLDNTVIFRFRVDTPPNGDPLPPDWPRGKIEPGAKHDEHPHSHNTVATGSIHTAIASAIYGPTPSAKPLGPDAPKQARAFEPFADVLKISWDREFLHVGANSFPDHPMMEGITAWNQQVPLPQPYYGDNAWHIPLNPEPAATAIYGKNNLFRGAIAVAVNGVPIFNPIKQDGKTDTNLAGELDEYGGHAGRADDYHYHLAPVFLNKLYGDKEPIAFAMDGYAVYGFNEPDGTPAKKLDDLNGHTHGNLGYHYHSTKDYPYLNGGLYGKTEIRNGTVANQPRAHGVRPYTRPLRGASITDFDKTGPASYSLKYDYHTHTHTINYTINSDGSVVFTFIDPDGTTKTENYTGEKTKGGGKKKQKGDKGKKGKKKKSP